MSKIMHDTAFFECKKNLPREEWTTGCVSHHGGVRAQWG